MVNKKYTHYDIWKPVRQATDIKKDDWVNLKLRLFDGWI